MKEIHGGVVNPKKSDNKFLRNWLPLLIFCVVAGLLATLWGYNYADGNAEEQLPFIFRAMDPGYLAGDFFTDTYIQYGPRTIFSEFIAFFTGFLPLTTVLFLLTLLANIAIAFLSSLISGYYFPDSKFSLYLAAAGVLTLKTFWLGYSNIIYRNFLEPEHLAIPLLLLGFLLIMKRKYILAAFSFGVAALFQALLGLEIGWILLGICLLEFIIQKIRKETSRSNLPSLVIGSLILAAFSVGLLYPYTQQGSIPAGEFINLVAYVRHPHHYLPSTFEAWQWGQAVIHLLGVGFVFWFAMKRSVVLRNHKRYLLLVSAVVGLLCLGGYLFVEIWPSRLWTSAQMFRLPYIIKWFSIVLLTGWVGNLIEKPIGSESRFFGLTAGISLVTPVSLAFVPMAALARNAITPRLKLPSWLTGNIAIFLVTLALVIVYRPELRTWMPFFLLFGAIWIMFLFRWKLSGTLVSSIAILSISTLFLFFASSLTPPLFLKNDIPVFSLYTTTGEVVEIADFTKNNTPADAILYVPPRMGEFRYLAERAIVVDFAAYPFQDLAMRDWYQRIVDCYGVSDQLGFDALPQLNESVYQITDSELKSLSEKYDFSYAVVYDATITNFPILFRTESFKFIQIPK